MFFNRRMLRPFDLNQAARFANKTDQLFRVTFRNAKGGEPAELTISDAIGDYGDSGIGPKDVTSFLSANRGKPVSVKLNSPGGFVYDGLEIYNALLAHDGPVTTVVTGIAASIASVILQAGDKRKAYENSTVMIHRAIGVCVGNEGDMADCRDWLQKVDSQLTGIYSARSGQAASTMLDFMRGKTDGTLFTADEALQLRLIDEVIRNGGSRNSIPRAPSNIDDEIARLQDEVRRRQQSAKARRRMQEMAGV